MRGAGEREGLDRPGPRDFDRLLLKGPPPPHGSYALRTAPHKEAPAVPRGLLGAKELGSAAESACLYVRDKCGPGGSAEDEGGPLEGLAVTDRDAVGITVQDFDAVPALRVTGRSLAPAGEAG